jgi:hypothetical protein
VLRVTLAVRDFGTDGAPDSVCLLPVRITAISGRRYRRGSWAGMLILASADRKPLAAAFERAHCGGGLAFDAAHLFAPVSREPGSGLGAVSETPAMAAKVTKRLWEIGDIVNVLEVWEEARETSRVAT